MVEINSPFNQGENMQMFQIIYRKSWFSKAVILGETESFDWAYELCEAYQGVYDKRKGKYTIKVINK